MRVVVLGAGYAGLTLARRLESTLPETADIVVVDESDTHLVQHEVHRVIRRPAVADAITVPLDEVLDRATIRTARVEGIDRDGRRVRLDDGSLEYDYAAVCLGAETAFYDLPGVEEHGLPLKRLDHAHRIRDTFLDACEVDGRAVVGGAGLSGVQVAGELAALAAERDADVDVTVLERLGSVAPAFPEAFRSAVRDALETAGVAVRTPSGTSGRWSGATADSTTGRSPSATRRGSSTQTARQCPRARRPPSGRRGRSRRTSTDSCAGNWRPRTTASRRNSTPSGSTRPAGSSPSATTPSPRSARRCSRARRRGR
jgi:NADH dehydrogenase